MKCFAVYESAEWQKLAKHWQHSYSSGDRLLSQSKLSPFSSGVPKLFFLLRGPKPNIYCILYYILSNDN